MILPEDRCKQSRNLTSLFLKSKNPEYKYIVLDVNSLTIVPYISDYSYTIRRMNITPAIRTIELYTKLKSIYPKAKFIFSIDNGISTNMKKIYPDYKGHRRHSMKSNLMLSLGEKSNNVYRYNISLLGKILIPLSEYFSIEPGEADFKIGFILKTLVYDYKIDPNDILTISGDRDLILTTELSNFLYKSRTKNKGVNYYFFSKENFICFSKIIGIPLSNPKEYLYYKALIGDKSDNIPSILSPKKAHNLIQSILEEKCNNITYQDIVERLNKSFKTEAEKSFKINMFLTNLTIINLFNEEILSEGEKIQIIQNFKRNNEITFNKKELIEHYTNLFKLDLSFLKEPFFKFLTEVIFKTYYSL